ncbi:hypothetical protein [Mucilaginibacter sp.]|uniref:hypothetical protein n=1 Tax=Mucilaginibacter sp. TaxID=1882438 RepID=UPI0035BBDD45
MKLKNFLFLGACIAMAMFAAAFTYNVASTFCEMNPTAALIPAGAAGVFVLSAGYADQWLPQGALFFAMNVKNIKTNANPKNIAGLQGTHFYALEEDIATWPAALTPDFATATTPEELVTIPDDDPFVMKTGKFFHKFPCVLEEGQVKSTMVGPTGSRAFENMAAFSNPGNILALQGHIAFIGNKKVIIVANEQNGTLRVVGTQEFPAQVDSYEAANGPKTGDGNNQKHGFKAYSPVPCPTYLAAIPLDATDV